MNVPFYISRRINTGGTIQAVIARIAVVAVSVSVAAIVITSSVVHGFRQEVLDLVRGLASDVVVTSPSTLHSSIAHPIECEKNLRQTIESTDGVAAVSEFVHTPGVLRSEETSATVIVKGVDMTYDTAMFSRRMTAGTLPDLSQGRKREILISSTAASRLGVVVGDRVELVTMPDVGVLDRNLFKVCGISAIATEDTGAGIALTDIRNLRKINGWNAAQASGFAVSVTKDPQDVAADINTSLIYNYEGEGNLAAFSVKELYPNICSWLSTHDINAWVIMVIMFVVALFNMITILLIMVIDRTRMVGILQSMGMAVKEIRRIFLYRSGFIVLRGFLYGNLAAFALIFLQNRYGFISLDETAYFVPTLPMAINVPDIAGLNIAFIVLLLLLMFGATAVISHIRPAEAVRYE